MSKFKCEKCEKEFTKKWNYKLHINRKTKCKKVRYTCEICKKSYSSKSNLIKHMKKKNCQRKIKNKDNVCIGCLKKYSSKSNLTRHQKNCKRYIELYALGDIKDEIKELKKCIQTIMVDNIKNININNYTTINQNLIINNFGFEDMKHLDKDFIKELLESPDDSVPKLIDAIHFSKNNPHNMNMMEANNNMYVFYNNWKQVSRQKLFDFLVTTNFERIDDFYEFYKKSMEKSSIDNYNEFADNFDKDKNRLMIKNNIEDMLTEKSKHVLENISFNLIDDINKIKLLE